MQEEQTGSEQALAELRRRLEDGVAQARLSKAQLSVRARLARTTVEKALRAGAPVPSAVTVAALARVLKLPVEELLGLLRRATVAAGPDAGDVSGPGRPLSE
ncbi:hypothetical protein [Streptomyces rhizosphaerihabitans]|uniref:hypothetical protein n=1 Tax=Streptomyces rhizosphaerihabitans TaxID=1266770 RepID=UPI0021BE9438|nr:hypothetical protein [Streptomyces rhizosphaerihabitans]MCT9011538.1 hypothetical protein [Streptomyces rhizosphaerihabitans]